MDSKETDLVLKKKKSMLRASMGQRDQEVGGSLSSGSLSVPSQSPPVPHISVRPLQLQGAGHNNHRLHTWSKAASDVTASFPGCGIFL